MTRWALFLTTAALLVAGCGNGDDAEPGTMERACQELASGDHLEAAENLPEPDSLTDEERDPAGYIRILRALHRWDDKGGSVLVQLGIESRSDYVDWVDGKLDEAWDYCLQEFDDIDADDRDDQREYFREVAGRVYDEVGPN